MRPSARSASWAPLAAALLVVAAGSFACATPDTRNAQERAADLAVAARVEAALLADPYIDAEHVTVDARRGVVRLSGKVGDDRDLRQVLHICTAVPGVQRVDDELEIIDFGRARHSR